MLVSFMLANEIGGWSALLAAVPEPQLKSPADLLARAGEVTGASALLELAARPGVHLPYCGALVDSVIPGSFAEANGIAPGSIILPEGRFVDEQVEGGRTRHAAETTSLQTSFIKWVTPTYELREIQVPKGLIGVISTHHRNVAYWYLKHGRRNGNWDREVLAAILAQGSDPNLAESCWALARSKGYAPDPLFHWSMAMISLAKNDMDAIKSYVAAYGRVEVPDEPSDFPIQARDWVQVGMVLGDMRMIQQVVEAFPQSNSAYTADSIREAIAIADAHPLGSDSPAKQAERMHRRSFLRDVVISEANRNPFLLLSRKAAAEDRTPPYRFNPEVLDLPVDHYNWMYLEPRESGPNVELNMEFVLVPHGSETVYLRGCSLGLDYRPPDKPDSIKQILTLECFLDSAGNLQAGSYRARHALGASYSSNSNLYDGPKRHAGPYQTLTIPPMRLDQGNDHTIKMVRVGFWAEALLDGKRVALVPVPPDLDKPILKLNLMGSKLTVRSLRAEILE